MSPWGYTADLPLGFVEQVAGSPSRRGGPRSGVKHTNRTADAMVGAGWVGLEWEWVGWGWGLG